MPLDHFVSQVHLRGFYSSQLRNRLYAIRKSDLKEFTPRSEDVCRIQDGNTNSYLNIERAIEDFLKIIEPAYNESVENLRTGTPNPKTIFTIAGFAAYVSICSPGGMRISSGMTRNVLATTGQVLENAGKIPKLPKEMGNSFLEAVNSGNLNIGVDPKHPQAIGISSIHKYVSAFGNFKWDILLNDTDSPFFTSDYPIAIETSPDPRILFRIVPLAPDIAIRILPTPIDTKKIDFTFPLFGWRRHKATRYEVRKINELLVRCAEDCVFFRDDKPWVKGFVAKNSGYRVEMVVQRFPTGNGGFLTWHRQQIMSR